ncbi:cytochrome b [Colwellia sp. MEBiC06753]
MIKNTTTTYGWLAIFFHWLTALVVIGMFTSGWWMVELNYYSQWYKTAPYLHKSVGLLLFALLISRMVWKKTNPAPVAMGSSIEQAGAKIAHTLLYLLVLVICLTGYLISTADGRGIELFSWFTIPSAGSLIDQQEDIAGLIHQYSAYGLMILVAIHALAAIKHHFINKDNTLKRMLSPRIETH